MSFDGGTRRTTYALLAIAWWILGTLIDRYILQRRAPQSLQGASLRESASKNPNFANRESGTNPI